jgi:hypothetical protein
MVARQIIRKGGLNPEDVALLVGVFEACWTQIANRYDGSSDRDRDLARERLATIIVVLGKQHHGADAGELQARAIETFARNS